MARDSLRLSVLRGMLAAFVNDIVAKKIKGEELPDEEAQGVVQRLTKQRKDSIGQFRQGGREDLAKTEEAELKILETFLPQMMTREEILKVAEEKKKKLSISDKSKIGVFIGALMKELKGKADGALVKAVAEELLR